MSHNYNKRLLTLGRWLSKESFVEEALEVNFLKTAISKGEAENTLNSSKRVPKILKAVLWEKEISYDEKDLKYLSNIYRQQVLDLLPNDIEDKEAGLAIQWLGSLGSHDKDFAKQIILKAVEEDPAFMSNTLVDMFVQEVRRDLDTTGSGLGSVRNKLERFFNWKDFMSEKDLMAIKSLADLGGVLEESESAIKEYQENKKYLDAEEGKELLGEDSVWRATVMHNKGAACELGKDTEWCTAAPGGSAFGQYYHPQDPLFFVELLETGDRYQVHFGSNQFMDIRDHPVDSEVKEEIVEALIGLGADKYLAARVYTNYESFYDISYDDEDFIKFADDIDAYIREVVNDKIEDGSFNDEEGSPVNRFLDELSDQIENDHMPLDDSEKSMRAIHLLAEHDPTRFFLEKLHIDYPEIAKRTFEKSILYPELNKNLFSKTHRSLNLKSAVFSGLLFEGDGVEGILDNDSSKKAFVINLLNSKRQELTVPHKIDNRVRAMIEDVAPGFIKGLIISAAPYDDWYVSFKNEIEIQLEDNFNLKYFKETTDQVGEDGVHKVSVVYRYPMNYLISGGFRESYPDVFRKVFGQSLDKFFSSNPTAWQIDVAIRDLLEAKMVPEYSQQLLGLFELGLKTNDHKRFSDQVDEIIRNYALDENISAKLKEMRESSSASFSKNLFKGLDERFVRWRSYDMTQQTLDDVDAVIRGLDTGSSDKVLFKDLHREVLESIRVSQRSNTPTGGLKTKPELGEDILLYLATFEPRTWDNLNLDFRSAGVTDYMRAKAKRGLSALSFSQAMQDAQHEEDEDED